ncbi:MAG TPA: tRNA preQ1(34) S-adenosylmethionine ribosyltransferase-isomerase QueA [Longimicrobiales bacterium]
MTTQHLPTSAFDYELPDELIARYPAAQRDESRLLVLERTGDIEHRTFRDIVDLIPAGDVLVLNETRVLPARILGKRPGGGEAEVLLLERRPDGAGTWEALVRPGARIRAGRVIHVADEFSIEVLDVLPNGNRVVRLVTDVPEDEALRRWGRMPLPPYIDRAAEATDLERYQTVYGTAAGSVAAPTAGLHFTQSVLDRLAAKGVKIARIVLHVGVGTFRPVEVEDPADHEMHAERFTVPADAAEMINETRAAGGKVWAVGTTVTRTLESVADSHGRIRACDGSTALFIRPGYEFRVVDRLLTNFHLPKSTLLMLVTALGGYERVMNAYATAVRERYRFYSYGDAMLIL